MADPAVTEAASLMCPHGGTLTVTPTSTALKAGGNTVINKTETLNGSIAGCSLSTVGTPCTGVTSVTGESSALSKAGSGAILSTSTLVTNQAATIIIVETQTVLKG